MDKKEIVFRLLFLHLCMLSRFAAFSQVDVETELKWFYPVQIDKKPLKDIPTLLNNYENEIQYSHPKFYEFYVKGHHILVVRYNDCPRRSFGSCLIIHVFKKIEDKWNLIAQSSAGRVVGEVHVDLDTKNETIIFTRVYGQFDDPEIALIGHFSFRILNLIPDDKVISLRGSKMP